MRKFPPSRPLSVTITTLGVFLFGLLNIWRAFGLGKQANLLLEWGVSLDPYIRLVVALLWALLFLTAGVALWQRRPFTRLAIPFLLLLYAIYQIALLFFFVRSPVAQQGWPLYIILYTAVILLSWWILNHTAVQAYFEGRVERQKSGNVENIDPQTPDP